MKAKVITQEGSTVVGIAARTSNAKEMTPDGMIPEQRARLMKENLLDKIPNKAGSSILAVYTDYASDKDGDYTYGLGAKVTSVGEVPAGMVAKKIPAGRYAVFTSESRPVFKVVFETWQKIWGVSKSELGGDRAYQADHELYDQRAVSPQATQVDVYIGIK